MPQPIREGISYTVAAQVLSMGFQFGSSIVLARGLSTEQYGLYGTFTAGILAVGAVLDMGGSAALTRYVAEYDGKGEAHSAYSVFASTLRLHAFILLFFWIVAAFLALPVTRIWFDGDILIYLFFVLACPLLVVIGDLISILYGLRELKSVAARQFLQHTVIFGLNAFLIWGLAFEVRVAVGIYTFVLGLMLVWLLYLIIPLIQSGRLSPNRDRCFKQIIRFALPVSGIYPINGLLKFLPILLVKAFGDGDVSVNRDVAFLTLAFLLGSVVEAVLMVVIKSGFGYLTNWYAQGKYNLLRKYLLILQLLIMGMYGGVILLSVVGINYFIELVYGMAYIAVNKYILLTLLVSFSRSVAFLYRSLLYTVEQPRLALWSSLIELLLYIGLAICAYIALSVSDWGIVLLTIAVISGGTKDIRLGVASIQALKDINQRQLIVSSNSRSEFAP